MSSIQFTSSIYFFIYFIKSILKERSARKGKKVKKTLNLRWSFFFVWTWRKQKTFRIQNFHSWFSWVRKKKSFSPPLCCWFWHMQIGNSIMRSSFAALSKFVMRLLGALWTMLSDVKLDMKLPQHSWKAAATCKQKFNKTSDVYLQR